MRSVQMTRTSFVLRMRLPALQQAEKQADQSVRAYVYEAVRRRMEREATETDTPG